MFFYNTVALDVKAFIFKRRINKFRKTKDCKLIIEKDFNNCATNLLIVGYYLLAVVLFFMALVIVMLGLILLLHWFIKSPSKSSGIITIIVAILGFIGVVYGTNKKRRDEKKDRFDTSIYIIIQYLIEIKRRNYNCKIFKDDLSYIFMNIPNTVLFILRDIQDNVDVLKKKKSNKEYEKVVNKEILFLIIYIREFYRITSVELKNGAEHEKIIEDIIDNSSIKSNTRFASGNKIDKNANK